MYDDSYLEYYITVHKWGFPAELRLILCSAIYATESSPPGSSVEIWLFIYFPDIQQLNYAYDRHSPAYSSVIADNYQSIASPLSYVVGQHLLERIDALWLMNCLSLAYCVSSDLDTEIYKECERECVGANSNFKWLFWMQILQKAFREFQI